MATHNDNPKRNREGYLDTTAFHALRNVDEEDRKIS